MKVYTRIDGKTAIYILSTDEVTEAREAVQFELARMPGSKLVVIGPIFAVVDGGKSCASQVEIA